MNEKPKSELGPCPFCGTTAIETVSPDMCETPAIALHSYPNGYRVECESCCTMGPWHHNHEDALAAWNDHHSNLAKTPDGQSALPSMESGSALLDALESMARQHCDTRKVGRDYLGQVAGTNVTDSGALSANAEALSILAENGRFRVVADCGRMVVGYWPENDPMPNTKMTDADLPDDRTPDGRT